METCYDIESFPIYRSISENGKDFISEGITYSSIDFRKIFENFDRASL